MPNDQQKSELFHGSPDRSSPSELEAERAPGFSLHNKKLVLFYGRMLNDGYRGSLGLIPTGSALRFACFSLTREVIRGGLHPYTQNVPAPAT